MVRLEVSNLTFSYPDHAKPALSSISLSVEDGEFVVLCGPSGCGKTTLLRHLKKELEPIGHMSGLVLYCGLPLNEHPPLVLVGEIGMVMQDPENQIVMEQVQQELVFAMENLLHSTEVMRRRVAEMCHFFGMETWLEKKTAELSGGQKQLLNLASVLLLQPSLLLLDEPTAQMDPIAAREFIQMVYRMNQEFGTTIIMTEHRLEEIFPLADQVVMMLEGSVKYKGSPRGVIEQIWSGQDGHFLGYLPSVSKVYLNVQQPAMDEVPLTVKEGRRWLQTLNPAELLKNLNVQPTKQTLENAVQVKGNHEMLLQCKNVYFQYHKDESMVLKNASLEVYSQDFLAVLGGNGTGKSTLLQIMAGLLAPQRGSVLYQGQNLRKLEDADKYSKIGFLAQNPMLYFTHDTVEEELIHAADTIEGVTRLIAKLFGIESLLQQHPYDCSGGERQKVAIAGILLRKPQLLLMDEPTKGLDPISKMKLGELLATLNQSGLTIVMVTHDVEFAAKYALRCAMLFDGGVSSGRSPELFFSENYFYTTAINRFIREWMPRALTCEDVLYQWNINEL
ncbi:MAG TPA: ABC transporter ATP-binding protein [Bacilli bacterium]